jgi:hypothetical protein
MVQRAAQVRRWWDDVGGIGFDMGKIDAAWHGNP